MKLLRFLFVFASILVTTSVFAQLPSVKLKTLDGKTIDTSELDNDGKPFVISFFATWCKPCNRELKAIHEVYADWQEETGMKLYAVSIDQAQNINKVKPLVDGEEWEYDILLDPNSDFLRAMNIRNIPHVFIIDGQGKIVFSHSGYTDGGENEIIEKIRELVSSSPSERTRPSENTK
ncbi:MAG: TlpA family protein disulfide reductase [Prevotella sp.]